MQLETVYVLDGAEKAVQETQLLSTQLTQADMDTCVQEKSFQSAHVGISSQLQVTNRSTAQNAPAFVTRSMVDGDSSASLMSRSSMESFKSAMSKPYSDIEQVGEVKDVIHAFRSALQVLRKLIRKRIRNSEGGYYFYAQHLMTSLDKGETTIAEVYRCVLLSSYLET